MSNTTRITVLDQEKHDRGAFDFGAAYTPGTLDRVIESLAAIRAAIPEEYRATASCEIDSVSGYEGSHYAHIEVRYDRPATPEEIAERELRARQNAEVAAQKERNLLAQLKAKYE